VRGDASMSFSRTSRPRLEFSAGYSRVLEAADIAEHWIDVDRVLHVINFELPNVAGDYVHRIGRTARAGAAGIPISFCSEAPCTVPDETEAPGQASGELFDIAQVGSFVRRTARPTEDRRRDRWGPAPCNELALSRVRSVG
jgi:Helicase conserved C-terminal domain